MRGKSWIGPALGVILLIFFIVVPPLAPLTTLGMRVVGIFLFTIIWWVTVGIGYPSLMTLVLIAALGVMKPADVLAGSWGNWVIIFVVGAVGISEGVRATGFFRRFAIWFITRPFVEGRPWVLIGMFLLACTLMGSVMSSTATTIVFMAIAASMLQALNYKKGDTFAAMLMMGIAWAATASLAMTPIAHAGNIMMMNWIQRDFNHIVGFTDWMSFGIPMGLLMLVVILLVFRFLIRPDVSKMSEMSTSFVRQEASQMGPMKLEEKVALGIFLFIVAIWILPDLVSGVFPEASQYLKDLGYAMPAIAGASLMCLIPVHGKPLLTFKQWMKDSVEWGSITLLATIMVMGVVLKNPDTGIGEMLTGVFQPIAMSVPFTVFIMISILWVVIQTNMMSNLVSMTLVYSIMVPVAASLGSGNPIGLGATIGAASNFAFSLPSATITTALAIGSGWVPVRFMAKYGVLMIIPVVLVFTFVGYPLATALFGG